MENGPSAWLPDSHLRSPAWRYLRALWLIERGKRAQSRFDDAEVRRMKRGLGAGKTAVPGTASLRAERPDPALAQALRLFCDGPPDHRWLLEAFLLTDEPLEVVASRVSLPTVTVRTFHDCFFDVRPYRDARDWIWLRAIRSGAWNGYAEDYPGCLWKGFGFAAGPLALELAVAVTTGAPFPQWVRESFAAEPAYEEARLRVLGKLLVGALRTTSPAELGAVLEAREQMRRLDHKALGTTDEPRGLVAAMEGFLRSVNSRPKSSRKAAAEPPKPGEEAQGQPDRGEAGSQAMLESLLESLT
jgi:hypothetical protein